MENNLPNLDQEMDQKIAAGQGAPDPNAAANPEGAADINASLSDDELKKLDQQQLNGLPNLDEMMANKASASSQQSNSDAGSQQQQTSGNFISDTFSHIGKLFGQDFKAPEGVTAENFTEKLLETLAPVYQKNLSQDALKFDQHLKSGGTPETYLQSFQQQQSFKNMTSDDALLMYYKDELGKSEQNPDGLEEDAIRSYIDKMDVVERRIKGKEIKDALVREQEGAEQQRIQQAELKRKEENITIKQNLEKMAADTIAKVGNINEIYGLPVTKQEIEVYNQQFKALIIPDDTGVAPATKLLYDDQTMYKLLFVAHKAGVVKDFLREAKNKDIQNLKDQLGINPVSTSGNASAQSHHGGIDLDKLSMPEIIK